MACGVEGPARDRRCQTGRRIDHRPFPASIRLSIVFSNGAGQSEGTECELPRDAPRTVPRAAALIPRFYLGHGRPDFDCGVAAAVFLAPEPRQRENRFTMLL